MQYLRFGLLLLLLTLSPTLAQTRAVDQYGQDVILHPDGTWKYGTVAGKPPLFKQMSPEEFRAAKPTKAVTMRAFGKLADIHVYEFRDASEVMWSIDIDNYDGHDIGWGYVRKKSKLGKFLFAKLRDGKKHKMVVGIQYLKKAQDGQVFLITDLLNFDSWLIPKGKNKR